MKYILLLLIFSFSDTFSYVSEVLKNRPYITPSMPEDEYAKPKNFQRTNNLRRVIGNAYYAKGMPLKIEGYVRNLKGEPLENVVVQIWHADFYGNYKEFSVSKKDIDIDFAGNGSYLTGKDGKYWFITVFPGIFGNRTPHIHFRIYYNNYINIDTEMFFPNHPRNKIDKKYQKLSSLEKELLTCDIANYDQGNIETEIIPKIAVFNIVLDVI